MKNLRQRKSIIVSAQKLRSFFLSRSPSDTFDRLLPPGVGADFNLLASTNESNLNVSSVRKGLSGVSDNLDLRQNPLMH